MKTAFLVLKSPQESDPTHAIKRFSDAGDASALLVEDGVYNATQTASADRLSKAAHEVLVSKEDLEARGLSADGLKVGRAVGYDDLVDCIMERTERTVTV